MKNESFLHQKKVRAMGLILAVISSLSLMLGLILIGYHLKPEIDSGPLSVDLFTELEELKLPDIKLQDITDAELAEALKPHYEAAKPYLPEGTTLQTYTDNAIHWLRTEGHEILPQPAEYLIEDYLDGQNPLLPEGISPDTTVRELVAKDHAFFEAHLGSYRLVLILTGLFYATLAVIILRMALAWRKEHPFGPATVRGLRWLGVIFLVQFFGSFLATPFLPYAEYTDLLSYSVMYDLAVETLFTSGANLSCGIVFLTLSWVMEHGRNMKEEQSLTI